MYVTRLFLNPRSQRVYRDTKDVVQLHRAVMSLFPDDVGSSPRHTLGVLHRLDVGRTACLTVQSTVSPDFNSLPDKYFDPEHPKPVIEDVSKGRELLRPGDLCLFRLAGNTTKKVDGKRVALRSEPDLMAWLERNANGSGFRVKNVRYTGLSVQTGAHANKSVILTGTRFDGLLEVVDSDLFRNALRAGIGPAKAFGYGLLSIRRLTE